MTTRKQIGKSNRQKILNLLKKHEKLSTTELISLCEFGKKTKPDMKMSEWGRIYSRWRHYIKGLYDNKQITFREVESDAPYPKKVWRILKNESRTIEREEDKTF